MRTARTIMMASEISTLDAAVGGGDEVCVSPSPDISALAGYMGLPCTSKRPSSRMFPMSK